MNRGKKQKIYRILSLLVCCNALTGCGQKGPLYLPPPCQPEAPPPPCVEEPEDTESLRLTPNVF